MSGVEPKSGAEPSPPMSRGSEKLIDLEITSLAAGGEGVGRDASGRVTFVAKSAVGDSLRVRLEDERSHFARAEIVEILSAAAERVTPRCPLFVDGSCGGCQWQHISVAEQARAKRALVESALRKIASPGDVGETLSPVAAYGWRRRAKLRWYRPPSSPRAFLGLAAARSHRIVPLEACPQLEPALEALLPRLQEALAPFLFGRGTLDLVSGVHGEVHAAFAGSVAKRAVENLVGEGAIAGARIETPSARRDGGRRGGRAEGRRRPRGGVVRIGAAGVELEGSSAVAAGEFSQASRAGNNALHGALRDAAGPLEGKRVLELFAGSGNLTRVLAGASEVLAVDEAPGAARSAPGVTVRRGVAGDVCAELASAKERFDLVVLDPPRAGAQGLMPIVASLTDHIIYVSCDPATLGRDLEALVELGFAATSIVPLDMMPQTAHVEVVAALRRR